MWGWTITVLSESIFPSIGCSCQAVVSGVSLLFSVSSLNHYEMKSIWDIAGFHYSAFFILKQCIAFLTYRAPVESMYAYILNFFWPFVLAAQSLCLTFCNLMDCSISGFPSESPGVCSNSCPLSQWCYLTYLILCRPLFLLPSIFPNIRI